MDQLPSHIMFDILLRLPVKCLMSARCVSKQWCEFIDDPHLGVIHGERFKEDPIPIMFHEITHHHEQPRTLCFHIMKSSKQTEIVTKDLNDWPHRIINYVIKDPGIKYVCQKPMSEIRVQLRGSCNGLILIAQDNSRHVTTFSAFHPRRKECYNLPPLPSPLLYKFTRESCGLGFDDSSNTFKAVCVFLKKFIAPHERDFVRKTLCTMVHVFGTNSWREIPQVPCLPVKGESVFAHGRLHWLVSFIDRQIDDKVIWFDVKKEEFGSICYPKTTEGIMVIDHLVDLNGEVGLVCRDEVTMEVWVFSLKLNEWVMRCQFNMNDQICSSAVRVLGCWNKDGDILIRSITNGWYRFFVYNLKHGATFEVDIVGREGKFERDTGIVMYPYSLLSICGINTNSPSLRSETVSRKRCRG